MPKYSSSLRNHRSVAFALVWTLAGVLAAHGAPALPYLSDSPKADARASGNTIALALNPAFPMTVHGTQINALRVPDTRVLLLAGTPEGGQTTSGELYQPGYTYQQIDHIGSLGDQTPFALSVGMRQEGDFTRVDHDGTSIHAFPRADWLVAGSLGRRLSDSVSVGGTAKWLRSKQTGAGGDPAYVHGWAFDAGGAWSIATGWRVGLLARNLSNGVGALEAASPTRLWRQVAVGLGHTRQLTDRVSVDLVGDARFPSKDGAQVSGGGSVGIGDRVRLNAGYERRVEPRITTRTDLTTGTTTPDEHLWVAQGPTFGGSILLGEWSLSLGASPGFLPIASDGYLVERESSRWTWSFGIRRAQ